MNIVACFPTKTWELCGTFGDFLLEMNVNQKKSTKKNAEESQLQLLDHPTFFCNFSVGKKSPKNLGELRTASISLQ